MGPMGYQGMPQMIRLGSELPGLFSCAEEGFPGDQPCFHFMNAYFCPCVPVIEIAAVASPETVQQGVLCQALWCIFWDYMPCYHGCVVTPKLRQKFGLPASSNCCAMYCCTGCAIEQYHKFIRTKLQRERWGQLTSGPRMGPVRQQMAQPPQQMGQHRQQMGQ